LIFFISKITYFYSKSKTTYLWKRKYRILCSCLSLPLFMHKRNQKNRKMLHPARNPDMPFMVIITCWQPVNALFIGFLLSFPLFPAFNKGTLTGRIGDGISAAAPVLLITGAGGAFGTMLKETQIGETMGNMLAGYHLGIPLPFIIAAAFKTAQGSSTVALVATSALIAPLLSSAGLDSISGRVLAVMTTGAGAMTISHVNNSYFRVVTRFSGMDVKTGYKTHTLATLIQGLTAIAFVYILSLIWG
jgi:gluconate:H+ symporter, GntP family